MNIYDERLRKVKTYDGYKTQGQIDDKNTEAFLYIAGFFAAFFAIIVALYAVWQGIIWLAEYEVFEYTSIILFWLFALSFLTTPIIISISAKVLKIIAKTYAIISSIFIVFNMIYAYNTGSYIPSEFTDTNLIVIGGSFLVSLTLLPLFSYVAKKFRN